MNLHIILDLLPKFIYVYIRWSVGYGAHIFLSSNTNFGVTYNEYNEINIINIVFKKIMCQVSELDPDRVIDVYLFWLLCKLIQFLEI